MDAFGTNIRHHLGLFYLYLCFLSYKSGGVSTGMNHVQTNTYDIQRLLHVKGKRKVTGTEVRINLVLSIFFYVITS